MNMDEWFMVNDGDVFSDYSTQTNGLMAYSHGKKVSSYIIVIPRSLWMFSPWHTVSIVIGGLFLDF